MSDIDKRAKQTLSKLLTWLVPSGMTPKERNSLAKTSGISPETLRTTIKRQSMSADTLLRLLFARGVDQQTLENLPQTNFKTLPPSEAAWIDLGRDMSETERKEYAELIRFLRNKWNIKPK